MNSMRTIAACLWTIPLFLCTVDRAGAAPDLGKIEYQRSCAICHGATGKGEAVFGKPLKRPVFDLTTLAERNGGVFPFAWVFGTIDGTNPVTAHGTKKMPVWGQKYRVRAAARYVDVPNDEIRDVRARILALVEYIYRLQSK